MEEEDGIVTIEYEPQHPESLKEQPPIVILSLYENVTDLIAVYGWFLLAACLALAYAWPKIRVVFDKWQEEREQSAEAAARHKNPDLHRTRQLAMEVARQRMQADHDARAKIAKEKAMEREAAKRDERLSRFEAQMPGRRLNEASTNHSQDGKEKASSKPEYNPLMGGGSSSGFRPSRRSCPGGGCG